MVDVSQGNYVRRLATWLMCRKETMCREDSLMCIFNWCFEVHCSWLSRDIMVGQVY